MKILASDLYKYIESLTPSSDRGVKHTDSLYEVNKTTAVAALIEVAFHDNRADANFIINNIYVIGEAIAKGVCDYFNVQFKKPQSQEPPTESTGGLYKVQVGAFEDKSNAEKFASELEAKGYSVYIYQD